MTETVAEIARRRELDASILSADLRSRYEIERAPNVRKRLQEREREASSERRAWRLLLEQEEGKP